MPDASVPKGSASGPRNKKQPRPVIAKEELEKQLSQIKYYCDLSKWANQESRDDFMEYEVEEDGFAPDADGDEDTDDEELEGPRKFLSHAEKSDLIKILSEDYAEDPPEDPLERVRNWAPKGLVLSGKQLLVAIHPDRFLNDIEKEKAHKAFVAVENALKGNRTANIEGTKIEELEESDNDKVDFLEEYHEKAHMDITKHLIQLYNAFKSGEAIEQTSSTLTPATKTAYDSIRTINDEIREKNKAIYNDSEFGVVEVDQITNCWKPQNGVSGPLLLWKLCQSSHYPMGWAYEPPQEDFTYDNDRGEYWASIRSRITSTLQGFWGTLQGYPDNPSDEVIAQEILTSKKSCDKAMMELNKSTKRPENLNFVDLGDIMAHYCGLRCFSATSMNEQFKNLRQHLRRSLVSWDLPLIWLPDHPLDHDDTTAVREESTASLEVKQVGSHTAVIKIAPRSIKFAVVPGFTRYGEKIIALQKAGFRFVIETDKGLRSLVDSGHAGGKTALDGALSVGVPYTVTSHDEIESIRSMLLAGNEWETIYVAMSLWDIDRLNVKGLPKLPYTVIGIRLQRKIYHLSRSLLSHIMGAKTVDQIVVDSMGGSREESLSDMLMSKLQITRHPKSLTDRPRAALAFDSSSSFGQGTRMEKKTRSSDLDEMKSMMQTMMKSMMQSMLAGQRDEF